MTKFLNWFKKEDWSYDKGLILQAVNLIGVVVILGLFLIVL